MDGRVFAAGDATDFIVKHGGIGAQQADLAAAGIAHLAGVGERPPSLQPLIRGKLSTGNDPLYIAAHVTDGLGWRSEVYEQPPWPDDEKIVAEELRRYLPNPQISSKSALPGEHEDHGHERGRAVRAAGMSWSLGLEVRRGAPIRRCAGGLAHSACGLARWP